MWKKFVSRKLIVAVFALITTLGLEIPAEVQSAVVDIAMAYLGAQGLADAAEKFKS